MSGLNFDTEGMALLSQHSFSMAMDFFEKAISREPQRSTSYFGRLLARKRCSSLEELIKVGFDTERETDFILALHFADDQEKHSYSSIKDSLEKRANELIKQLNQKEKQKIIQTGIIDKRKQILESINGLRKELKEQLNLLSDQEKLVADMEAQCLTVINSIKKNSQAHYDNNASIKSEISYKEELTDEEMSYYDVQLETNNDMCRKYSYELEGFNKTELFEQYQAEIKKRNDIKTQVEKVIVRINAAADNQTELLEKIRNIQQEYIDARERVFRGQFETVNSL